MNGHTSVTTAGYVLIVLVGALFPIVPSVFLLRAGWRRGGWARAAAAVAVLLLATLALPVLWVDGFDGIEERVVAFVVMWFALLVVLLSLGLVGMGLRWVFLMLRSVQRRC